MSLLKPKTKIIRTIHGYTATSKLSKGYVKQLADRLAIKRFDCVVGVSDNMTEFGVDKIISNGITEPDVDLSRVDQATLDFIKSDDHIIIGCVARLSPEKNLQNLIAAMEHLPTCKLVILGDGPLKGRLKFQAAALFHNYPRVHFTGFVSNPTDYMGLFDIYVQPSYTEGLPISVLEAMSLGKICVLSKVGGMKNLVINGGAAHPFYGLSSEDIKDTLDFVIRNDLERHQHIYSDRAKKVFQQNYTAEIMADSYSNVYKMLTSE